MAGSGSGSNAAAAAEEESERLSAVGAVRDAVPFMLQVLVVFVIAWLLLPVTFHGFIILCLLSVYLLEVEKRNRKRERSEIASAERRKLNTKRTFDEGETSRWLNEGIKRMWPVCMQKFASKHFFGPMAPHFLEEFKPWIVKEAKLNTESLHLGSTPPVFNFIRALESPPDGDHLAYEADMDFSSSGDMKAEMSVLMRLGNFWTTFYISNLHIEGKVRISVQFLEGWPVVGRVRLCFASTPQVTMSYRPYNKNFLDASLFPVVANQVMKALDNAMVHSIVQPNMLVVDVKALATMLSPDSQGASATETKPTLVVEILEATNLIVADINGYSDPFVEIQFGLQKEKTKVIKRTLNPKWENEQHQFSIANWDMSNLLTLRVRDWDWLRFRASYELGILTVPVNELYKDGKLDENGKPYEFGRRYEFNRPLEKVRRGYLRFAITVNHTHPPQTPEEPHTSDTVSQTATHTQEIRSAVDYVVNDLVGTTTEMKRSKSDTNLSKLDRTPPKRPKEKAKRPQRNTSPELSQVTVDETHDVITMPYGPRGAFTIFHPGSVTTTTTPPSTRATGLVNEPAPRMRNRLLTGIRGVVRRRKSSQESVLTETMSERSGSFDSTELKKLDAGEPYHGPVRMDLIDVFAPEDPPELIPVHKPAPQLEPIMSGKTASNSHPVHAPRDLTDDDDTTVSHPVDAPNAVTQPAKKPTSSSLPKTWVKKIKSLAAKARKKKKTNVNGVAYSTELEYGEGYPDEAWDPTVSRWDSFTVEALPLPLPLHYGSAPGSVQGDSPELRKLVHETRESRAAGSQSDRPNWVVKGKQWIRDQSKSFRMESRPKVLAPAVPAADSIPEKPSVLQRNGKVSV